ncbi:MAG: WG repeat-containing protein [Clostridia bacterium]|nr:WG repeat-containing protein [Clostridia bacterium]
MKLNRLLTILLVMLLFAVPAYARELDDQYDDAVALLSAGRYAEAAQAFSALGYYEDASQLAMYCYALNAGEHGLYATAVGNFESLGSFRDSALQAKYYAALFYEEAEKYEDAYELLDTMSLFRDASARIVTYPAKINARDYAAAEAKEQAGNLESALTAFRALIPYSDSAARADAVQEKIRARDYAAADAAEQAGKLESALSAFQALVPYSDSAERVTGVQEKIKARDYAAADQAEQDGDYAAALTGFTALGDYLDSAERAAAVQDKGNYALGLQYANSGNFSKAYELFAALGDYEDSAEKAYALGVTTFANVRDRFNGVAAFEFHGLWGVINVNTNTTVSPYWDEIGYFNEHGLAKVKKGSQYGYIDTQGNVVVPCQWYDVSEYAGGYCTVAKAIEPTGGNRYGYSNYVYGLYDAQGNEVTPAQWRTLGLSANSSWLVGYRDSNYSNIYAPAFSDGKIKVQNPDGLWGFIDEQGQLVGSVEWWNIDNFSEGLAAVTDSNSKVGFIDGEGNVVIKPQYDATRSFHEGLAAVRVGSYWRYIDQSNNVVISANYTDANSFSGGKADVFLEGTGWQIIDNQGGLLYFINEQTITDYNRAVELMNNGEYADARELFLTLSGYKDSATLVAACDEKLLEAEYNAALELLNAGDYQAAGKRFKALEQYKDASAQLEICRANGAIFSTFSVASTGSYGFELNAEGYYESQNKGHDGTIAQCTLTISSETGFVYLDVINSGEYKYDYGCVYMLDSTSSIYKDFSYDSTTYQQTLEFTIPDENEHTIYIIYKKDGSTSSGNDSLQFKVRFE